MRRAALLLLLLPSAEAAATEVSGYVQLDYLRSEESSDQLDPATGEPANLDRFLIRRGRLRAAEARRWVGVLAELDFNTVRGPAVGPRAVEAQLLLPPDVVGLGEDAPAPVRLGAGLFRAPFGYEVGQELDQERLFAERTAIARALFPGEQDVGAYLAGELPWLSVTVAVQNGEPLGTAAWPGRDPNAAKDLLGRIVLRGQLGGVVQLEAGASTVLGTGFHQGTLATKDTLVWRDRNEDGIAQQSELQLIRGAAATPSEDFERWGLGGEARASVALPPGRLTLTAEVVYAENLDRGLRPADPVLLGIDQREQGAYVSLTQELFGRVIVGARVERYEPSLDASELEGGTLVRSEQVFEAATLALGLRHEERGVRAALTVDATLREDPLGRDAAGRPADLANDTLTLRLQVGF